MVWTVLGAGCMGFCLLADTVFREFHFFVVPDFKWVMLFFACMSHLINDLFVGPKFLHT